MIKEAKKGSYPLRLGKGRNIKRYPDAVKII